MKSDEKRQNVTYSNGTGSVIEITGAVRNTSRYIVNIYDEPVTEHDMIYNQESLRSTRGCFFIKYNPPGAFRSNSKYPFVIGNDLLGFKLQVTGSSHFRSLTSKFPEVAWMIRNTNYNDELFAIAKLHYGELVYFTLNFVEYYDKIAAKAKEKGIDMKNFKALVSVKSAQGDFKEEDKSVFITKGLAVREDRFAVKELATHE